MSWSGLHLPQLNKSDFDESHNRMKEYKAWFVSTKTWQFVLSH